MSRSVEFIDTPESLDHFLDHLETVDMFAIDTEFHRERTYYAQLCLIQIATEERIVCVDPIALSDLNRLMDIIFDPRQMKILHSGSQDLELFHDLRGDVPAPVFDTQLAATLTGHGDQIGYGGIVERICEISLAKEHTRTDWRKRPLSQGQLDYAADDVRYLHTIQSQLTDLLESLGRMDWFHEECARLVDPQSFKNAPEDAWSRVKGVGKLRGAELNAARVIAGWREEQAIRIDKPRRWVIPDPVILDIARVSSDSPQDIDKVEGLSSPWLRRQKDTFLHLLKLAHNAPRDTWPSREGRPRLTPGEEQMMKAMQNAVKACAEELNISATMLATRRDLDSMLRASTETRIHRGWRRTVVLQRLESSMQAPS